jgi:hypothetical protein
MRLALSRTAFVAALAFGAPAWAQAPMSPSAAAAVPHAAAASAPPAATPGVPAPAGIPAPAHANSPAAAGDTAAVANRQRSRRQATRMQVRRSAEVEPIRGDIANDLNAGELARINQGPVPPEPVLAPAYPPRNGGPAYYPPPPGYLPYPPPAPPPAWGYGRLPY